MSTKKGKIGNHRFHGDPDRFAVLAAYINENYRGKVKLPNPTVEVSSPALRRERNPAEAENLLRVHPQAYVHGFPRRGIKTIADVADGQGMLSRILSKKYNFDCEVIDPRGYPLIGVKNRKEEYRSNMADYYDLIVGLHPDEALKEVVYSAIIRPVIVIPCCNFWSRNEVLGWEELLKVIEKYYSGEGVQSKRVIFDFSGPKNIGLVSAPPITTRA